MLADILTVVIAIISAVLVGFVARRVLETPVGWPRSIVVGLIVFACGLPFASWVLDETRLLDAEGRARDVGIAFTALAVLLLAIAWVFALGVATLVCLEAIFPTRPLRNPIDVIRAGIRSRRRTRRYLQILSIASRHGVPSLFRGRGPDRDRTSSEQRAAALVRAINESGVTFVKLGQVLSSRRDLIPEPYLGALSSLQTDATTLPWQDIRRVIEDDIGGPIETVYREIDERPLAAASVAQVHRGILRDGTPVAVKVQRPAARAQVQVDVDIILRLAQRAERKTRLGRDMRVESVARGFTSSLHDELDYRIEATNTEMIRLSLAQIAEADHGRGVRMVVPRVHPEGSGPRILTMDMIDGVPLSHASPLLDELTLEERDELASGFMLTVIQQILVHGVFHADLHPGNVLLRADGSLGLIDFGAIGVIERSQRQNLTALMLAAVSDDDVAATDALLMIVDVPDGADVDAFRHDVGVVLTAQRFRPSGDSSIFARLVDVIRRHRVALPGDLASAFRSFATLEGCLRVISPDFDMIERAMPAVPTLLRRMVSVRRFATGAQAQAAITAAMVRSLPRRIDTLVSGLEKGSIGIKLRPFSDEADQGFLRTLTSELVGAIVSIAAVIAAVVLIVTDAGPVLAEGLRLFDLFGALIGFFGFLGLLRVVRQLFVQRSRR